MMKTVKRIMLIVVMFISLLSYAEKKGPGSNIASTKVVDIRFDQVKKGQKLLVKEKNGLIIHSEKIKSSGNFNKKFDLNKLKDGSYTIELVKDFEIVIRPFNIKGNTISFSQNNEKKIFKPSVRTQNSTLMISQLTLESNPVEVKIYYKNDLIFTEKIEDEKIVNRIYKLEDKLFGDYKAVIKTDNRTYVEHFKI